MEVANCLDQNKGILPRRYFRQVQVVSLIIYNMVLYTLIQDCTLDMNGYTKDLSMVCEDLGSIFILDNSPAAYRGNPGKCYNTLFAGKLMFVEVIFKNVNYKKNCIEDLVN